MIDYVDQKYELIFTVVVSRMRVDPKHLRGFHEIGIALILVVGAGGLIGAASVSSVWKRPSSVKTVPVSGIFGVSGTGTDVGEVSHILPDVGTRVAVFLTLEKRSSVLLFSDVRVLKEGVEGDQLDITGVQNDILQLAKKHGYLSYRVIPGHEVSPYSGQDVRCMEDLEHIIGR
jgi:hypothetical protein